MIKKSKKNPIFRAYFKVLFKKLNLIKLLDESLSLRYITCKALLKVGLSFLGDGFGDGTAKS